MSESRPTPVDVLAIFAHPDDAELLAGGALALSVDRGERVGILDLTRGELGSRGSPELRAEEARAAQAVLGVHERAQAGLRDGQLEDGHAARRAVATWIRTFRPRVVVTHPPEGRHPDHQAASALVQSACFLSGLRNLEADGTPFRPEKLVFAPTFREDAPPRTLVVDVTSTVERKLEALACYRSQFEGARGMGEVFPGGERTLLDQVRAHMAVVGSRIRVAYGEPFVIRDSIAVSTLGGIAGGGHLGPVSSW
jgi:N-acetylglucosamine malate deacetylase 1